MVGIPTAVLMVTVVALAVARLRERPRARSLRLAALPMLFLLSANAAWGETSASASPSPDVRERWNRALGSYATDPARNRRTLLALRREGLENLPPYILLAMADSRLRTGNRAVARRLFQRVIDRSPGEPWVGWAHLGLAWLSMAAGQADEAGDHFRRVADSSSPSRDLARLALALLDAQTGRTREARATFDALAERADVSVALRQVARIGGAYARYWSGEFGDAAEVFERAVAAAPDGPLADDARYGAALARWRTGARAEADTVLRDLADLGPSHPGGEAPSRALVWLERGALLRQSFHAYRRMPLRAPEEQLVHLIDHDGSVLARGFLKAGGAAPGEPNRQGPRTTAERTRPHSSAARATSQESPTRTTSPTPRRAAMLAALIALAVPAYLWLRNRLTPRGAPSPPRRGPPQ
jgi:hypothetical protein